jgi:hypothetical protein
LFVGYDEGGHHGRERGREKERERERETERKGTKDMPPVTFFLTLGLTC